MTWRATSTMSCLEDLGNGKDGHKTMQQKMWEKIIGLLYCERKDGNVTMVMTHYFELRKMAKRTRIHANAGGKRALGRDCEHNSRFPKKMRAKRISLRNIPSSASIGTFFVFRNHPKSP